MKWLVPVVLACLALASAPSYAARQSVSYSTWTVSGNFVNLRFMLPASEAGRLIGTDLTVVTVSKLGQYLLRNVGARSMGGECKVLDQGYDLGLVDPLAVGPGLYGFEIFFHCPQARGIVLRDSAVFAHDADHLNIAHIDLNGRPSEQIFTARKQRLELPDNGSLASQSFLSYASMGAEHFFDGLDRLCVLLGLTLLIYRRRDVGYVVGALALGYVLSGVVASVGWVAPRLMLVDAFVAFLAALCGLAVAVRNSERPRKIVAGWSVLLLVAGVACAFTRSLPVALLVLGAAALSAGLLTLVDRREGMSWTILAGLLGFLDGFVWSAVLAPAEMSTAARLDMMIGLDAGALLVEVLLIGALVGVFRLVHSGKLLFPRPLFNDVCAAGLAGFGTYWFVSRLFT